jgi:integrator complex subunit 5
MSEKRIFNTTVKNSCHKASLMNSEIFGAGMLNMIFYQFLQNLLQEVRSFVLPSKGPGATVNILDRTRSAIVLMRCLPCARAAVLEQICEIFQEAVHKHIIETDRQDLLGSGEKAEIDPEIYEVIQNIHDTLLEFINNNPDAWAPIITKVEFLLL